MSDLIPGKRYRYTVTGLAVTSDGQTFLAVDEEGRSRPRCLVNDVALRGLLADGHATLEQLPDPLPTMPGSVVRKDNMTYLRQSSDCGLPWVDSANECWDDGHLAGATVLFDAATPTTKESTP